MIDSNGRVLAVMVWMDKAWRVMARRGEAVMARLGMAWLGGARQGGAVAER